MNDLIAWTLIASSTPILLWWLWGEYIAPRIRADGNMDPTKEDMPLS